MSRRDLAQLWDVVVVGAGPAGATAALAARRRDPGASVLLLDRHDFPRDKCCGDGIAPHVVDVLRSLGAADVVDGWEPLRRLDLSREASPAEGVAGRLARPVWVIPREVFDARLVDKAVEAGAVLRRHRVRALRVGPDEVVLDDEIRARVVIGADGAHSVVRGAAAARTHHRRALAVRGYAPTLPSRRGRQVIRYGDRRQPAYAWAFDRGDGLSNVGYGELVGEGEAPSRATFLEELERLLPGTVAEGTQWRGHHLPLSGRGWGREQPAGPLLLVGDAAGLVNPMTGEGIYYAVATGALAGRGAVDSRADPQAAGARHRRDVRRLLGRHLHHTWVTSRLSRHPAVVDAGIRAAARSEGAFDDLVEIGLGRGRVTPRLAAGLMAGLTTSPRR